MSDAEFVRHPYKLRQRSRAHLAHNLAPMDSDRDLAGAKLGGSLLIRESRDYERESFALARVRNESSATRPIPSSAPALVYRRPERMDACNNLSSPNGIDRNSTAPAFIAHTECAYQGQLILVRSMIAV